MSDFDVPAGAAGGPVPVPAVDDLPEKMRVHALARLLGRTSREVISALAELGVVARTAQSSIDRKAAEQVVAVFVPGIEGAPGAGPEPAAVGHPGGAAPDQPAAESAPVDEPAGPLTPLFAPPTPLFQPPAPPEPAPRGRRRRGAEEEPADAAVEAAEPEEDSTGAVDAEEDEDSSARRRRRRGRRGRGRGRGSDEDTGPDGDEGGDASADEESADDEDAESADAEADEADGDEGDDGQGEDGAGSRRRRRRRRRRGNGEDAEVADDSDPPNTVVRVRQPRERDNGDSGDGVQSVRGSTRLEAKRQRRRDGRDAGRRRVPILTEAEFLARRESVDRTMVVRERGDRIEIGVLEDDILVEHFVAGSSRESGNRDGGNREGGAGKSLVGNIYLGRVQNVLPSMEAAFVDIGRGRNAVLYAGEVDWDAAGLGGKARRIEQALNSGDSVLVQVTKDPIGHKGARLTTQISLAGRFLVYVPSGGAAGISRKLPDVERKRLKDMLKEIVPSEAGVIIRTASEGVSQEALERDVRRLQAQWDVVKTKSEQTGPSSPRHPCCSTRSRTC